MLNELSGGHHSHAVMHIPTTNEKMHGDGCDYMLYADVLTGHILQKHGRKTNPVLIKQPDPPHFEPVG